MVLRKLKRRKGDYPPNPTQWDAENNGISLRGKFNVPSESPLRPFDLEIENVHLFATRAEIGSLVDKRHCKKLFGIYNRVWSGITIPVDNEFVVIINPTHSSGRRNATLMEEYFHILLDHRPSKIYECKKTGLSRREFDPVIEKEAYHSASAALVPFKALKKLVSDDGTVEAIAEHFEVSEQLVNFRLKTCKLYNQVKKQTAN